MKKLEQRRRDKIFLSILTVIPVITRSRHKTANQDRSVAMTLEVEIQLRNDQQRLDQTIIAEFARVHAK